MLRNVWLGSERVLLRLGVVEEVVRVECVIHTNCRVVEAVGVGGVATEGLVDAEALASVLVVR